MAEERAIPNPGPGEVRIKVLAAGTGFTDTMIRRGRYPDFKGPLPFTPGYEIVGVVEQTGPGVVAPIEGQMVADLCVVGGYAQYAIRPARFLIPVPDGIDPAEAVCLPLAYLTAFQMLTRYRSLPRGAVILIVGASGTVGTALLDLARHLGLEAIGTCSAGNRAVVERFGAAAIDYHVGDFVTSVRRQTAGRPGVDAAFDAIGGPHFRRSFACLAPGGLLVGFGSQTMAVGGEACLPRASAWRGSSCGMHSASFSAAVARSSTALRPAGRLIPMNSGPTWRRCFSCCAQRSFIRSSSTDCRSPRRARSMPASTRAGSAARLCCCPGPNTRLGLVVADTMGTS